MALRIISGKYRGRRIEVPAVQEEAGLRPTGERIREAVFNKLEHHFQETGWEDIIVADICCGSGALGFEALSRGAASVTFIDRERAILNHVRATAEKLKIENDVRILCADATRLPSGRYLHGLVFLDPPYGKSLAKPMLEQLASQGWLAEGAKLVVETDSRETLPELPGYAIFDERRYGRTTIWFVEWNGT